MALSSVPPEEKGGGVLTDWEHTFDVVSDCVSIIDARHRFVRINKAMADKFGVNPEEVVGRTCYEVCHAAPTPPPACPFTKMMREGRECSAEMEENRLGGCFEVTVSPRRGGDGAIVGCVHVARNISERKRCEDRIRGEKEYLQQIIQSLAHPFYVIDAENYHIVLSNAAFGNAGEAGNTCYALTHKRDKPCAEEGQPCPLASVRETKRPITVEHVHYDKSGAGRIVEVHGYPLLDKAGNVRQLIEYCVDITERRRAEEALRRAHAKLDRRASELDAVNRELEGYSYAVSHALKAPLRRIQGFSQALLEDCRDGLDGAGRDYVERINAASQRTIQLIEAVLNMARLTRNDLYEREVNLSALAQIIAHKLQKREPTREVRFVIADRLNVRGDMAALDVVMLNLLENAWKFSGKHATAFIEFGVVLMNGTAVYFVRDDGAGFAMEHAEGLFKPFRRLHSEAEFPGLGIGLAIAAGIIARHGGRIWAESGKEKGATFYFTLQ